MKRVLIVLLAVAGLALGLVGCDKSKEGKTAGEKKAEHPETPKDHPAH